MAGEGQEARRCLDRAFSLCRRRGLATWDPFDIKGSRLAMWTYRARWRAPLRKALWAADLLAPKLARRALGLRPAPSAGGVAHWLQAVLAHEELGAEDWHLGLLEQAVAWLVQDARPGPAGHGWGLPFDWQAFVEVPAGTPIGHTTMAVLNALLDLRGRLAVPDRLVEDGLEFLAHGLNQTERPSGSVALSYTPLDRSQVVNTNAEIAALLLRAGRAGDAELARRILAFVGEAQNPDGSWCYSAPDAGEGRQVVDNYHTAMILDALTAACPNVPEVCRALTKGWEFHLAHHFEEDGCPRMRPHTRWPVDAYSAGQSLLALVRAQSCPALGPDLAGRCAATADRLAAYVVRRMAYPDGGFVYRRWPLKAMRLDSLRWADALLCHALAEYCRHAR